MSQQLISLSPDLKRLRDEGYEIEVQGGFLLIHHIPYLNSKKEILFGTLVSTLTIANRTTTGIPDNHVIHFIGENPCDNEGTVISSIQHGIVSTRLTEAITINYSFSNKPPSGYRNYYEKVKRYADLISAPAKFVDPGVTEKTFKPICCKDDESVFQYVDTNESRANIVLINSKFRGQKIAIIGLGGTGAYVLDLIAKTPVDEIHLFDGDGFDQHNAFRSPGAASISDLDKKLKKTEYFTRVYAQMHKGVTAHGYYIKEHNLHELDNMSYAFICVDKNSVRKLITDYLVEKGIPFIDVGLGVNVVGDKLTGAVRVTSATEAKNDHLPNRIFPEDSDDNDYATNIQIADLNLLNAGFAVMKWKKMTGFYVDLEEEHHSSYSIGVSKIFNEDATS